MRPERTRADFPPLAVEPGRRGCAEAEIRDRQLGSLRSSCAGVVEEEQQGVVPAALSTAAIGNREQSVHLVLVEVGHHGRGRATKRDRLDLRGVVYELGHEAPDEPEQRVEGGEALVPRGNRVAAFLLKVGKEAAHDRRVDLFDGDPGRVGRVPVGDETEEQTDRVAVALLGIGCEVAVGDQLFEQEPADEGSDQM